MQFKLGELFCGAGGLAWGAIHAGLENPIRRNGKEFSIRHSWANDVDEAACRTYAANIVLHSSDTEQIQNAVIAVDDWRSLTAKNALVRAPSVLCGKVENLTPCLTQLPRIDAFAFGFPCNDFSSVGERKGLQGKFGPLYSHGVAVLKSHKPRWFVAENVEGLLHRDNGKTFSQILFELEQAGPGYVLSAHLYRFEEYGVPQTRTRLVIVGISRQDYEQGIRFRVPAPTTALNLRTAAWAMEHEPTKPDVTKPLMPGMNNHKIPPITDRVRNRLIHTLPGQNAWNAAIPQEFRLNVKRAHLSMIYRRLSPDEPSYTITGNGGGGTRGYHWAEPRALTNRERARLQSFPDDFVFYGGEESVRRQIGMAVPPLAAKIIFEAILMSYAGIEYDSVDSSIGVTANRRLKKMREQCANFQHSLPQI